MDWAYDDLRELADGVQLTPGNAPTPRFREHLSGPVTTHHGFSFVHRKAPVWSESGELLTPSDSVHPPLAARVSERRFCDWVVSRDVVPILEIMVPGYVLGDGAATDWAMDHRLALAIDVSHVFIQRSQGLMDDVTWRRVQDYDRVVEVHVSANDGRHDTHAPLRPSTFGLEWARARLRSGTTVVLECYMHKLSTPERRRQIDLVRGAT